MVSRGGTLPTGRFGGGSGRSAYVPRTGLADIRWSGMRWQFRPLPVIGCCLNERRLRVPCFGRSFSRDQFEKPDTCTFRQLLSGLSHGLKWIALKLGISKLNKCPVALNNLGSHTRRCSNHLLLRDISIKFCQITCVEAVAGSRCIDDVGNL